MKVKVTYTAKFIIDVEVDDQFFEQSINKMTWDIEPGEGTYVEDTFLIENIEKVTMTKEQFLGLVGHFTWSYHDKFYVETAVGNFVWSDPEYNGDDTFTRFEGGYKSWCRSEGIPYGRDKGKHVIRKYCGGNIRVIGFTFSEGTEP